MSGPARERGVALITVLLVIALATIAAVEMTRDAVLDRRRTGSHVTLEQAHQLALGGEQWAISLLAREAELEAERQAAGEAAANAERPLAERERSWPRVLPPVPIEGGQIGGQVADAQGYFNINSLVGPGGVDAMAMSRFQALLGELGLDRRIAMAAVDWIDRDGRVTHPGGGEDPYYLGLSRPYRAANQPMESASELRRVRGVDAATWQALAPHVTALPQATPINVATAGPVVLQAVVPGLDAQGAETLAESQFRDLNEFLEHPLVAPGLTEEDGLAIESRYFRSRVDVELGPIQYTLYSWLQREDDDTLRVLRRARTPN